MPKLRIGIADDDPVQTARLSSLAEAWPGGCRIRRFSSAETLLMAYDGGFDLLLLDIEMGGMNGVELAKALRSGGDPVQLCFITGYPD